MNQKGYKCLDSNGELFIYGHVVFNENILPIETSNIKTTQKVYNPVMYIPSIPLYASNQEQRSTAENKDDFEAQHTVFENGPSQDIIESSQHLSHTPTS